MRLRTSSTAITLCPHWAGSTTRSSRESEPSSWILSRSSSTRIWAAIVECQKARALNDDPSVLGVLARAYGLSGNKMEAEKILDQLKELSKQRYVSAYSFALVYLGLGDKEEELRWLEQSYQDRAGSDIGFIRVDPLLDPLRGDPRFEALAEKIVPMREFRASSK